MAEGTPRGGVVAWICMRIAAFRQTAAQVFKRNTGDRALVGPCPVKQEARLDWQCALLSVAAYGRSDPKRHPTPAGIGLLKTIMQMWQLKKADAPPAPNVDAELEKAGWTPWSDFPDPTLKYQMHESHLRAEVWENVKQSLIVVAFGGTVATSGKDWKSNLRWIIPWHKDEYTEIVGRFGPDFVQALANRLSRSDMPGLPNVKIYSTGHSLGGGLAQQFAYAMPRAPNVMKVPTVSEVYAFDPSPVTGFYSVHRATRNANRNGLQIARIYERGEVLAILRSFTSLFIKPSSVNPTIRGVRFSLFYSMNPIAGHSIQELACKMRIAAGEGA